MIYLKPSLESKEKELQELLKTLKETEKEVLPGKLRISSDNGNPKYYHFFPAEEGNQHREIYLKKNDLELARKLAQQDYEKKVRKIVKDSLLTIDKLLQNDVDDRLFALYNNMNHSRKQLITPVLDDDEAYIKNGNSLHMLLADLMIVLFHFLQKKAKGSAPNRKR